ncbi:CoA transferase [Rhodoferax sp.]|uniref:CoA transferase n=1 Tax=Rhodoferax sp. TaxID=50421 RepID=UPI00272FEC58|nr:CoA transferase [Rhodoferax sp.]MDP1529624.1 CoA transferase [Rhodoferax sp.]MDP1945398.1 CoA transferase [Rhodoferax sp.]MDP2441481.1 CoA transferase [Rhodoferax sp.]MDZ4207343.1 CoA transferase [Rhodoferax sp.]
MATSPASPQALKGVNILSLSLNLPGPAALLRLRQMGASCVKFEPPAPANAPAGITGDPMSLYSCAAYDALHAGIRVETVDLKTEAGQHRLHSELANIDVLLTSFRPSALRKLGLDWDGLHQHYPALSLVAIVGAPGPQAELPGHDLTYLAENELVTGLDLPATLYADMGGALMAVEAVLQAVLLQGRTGQGHRFEVALSQAAAHLAQPHHWGLTQPGTLLGGGHAGYQLYRCLDGRVALAALEPNFARSLCTAAGLTWTTPAMMMEASTRQAIAGFVAQRSCQALQELALQHDIPLHTLQN